MARRPSVHYVRGQAMSVLAYPARIELVEALSIEQPATVEQLARRLAREPRSLYAHLRPLVAAGLVVQAGTRPTAKRPARLYRLPAEHLELDPDDTSRRAREARAKIGRAVFRTARRLHERGLADPATRFGGDDCSLVLGFRIARLTPAGRRRVDKKLLELFELVGREHDDRGEPFAVTYHMAPAPAPTRGRTRRRRT